jgi:hypothetical protein
MTCKFRSGSHPVCLLGMYGGMPSAGLCARCVERGENTPEHAAKIKATPPSLSRKAATLGKALLKWSSSGFAPTPPDALAERTEICKACPEWDAKAFNETGRCKKCGCSTWAKLRMASEKCPIDKWGPVTPSSPEQHPNTN